MTAPEGPVDLLAALGGAVERERQRRRDLLGHRIEFAIDHPGDDGPPQREGSADALVERADPWMPPIGFAPLRRPERDE